MLKLKDLGYEKQVYKHGGCRKFTKAVSVTDKNVIWMTDEGHYTSDKPLSPREHEAIAGELFEIGVYQMIGKHFCKNI